MFSYCVCFCDASLYTYIVLDSRSVERKSKRTNPRSRIVPRRLRGGGVMYSRRGGDLAERCPRTRTDKRPSDGQTLAVAIGYFHIIYTYARHHRLSPPTQPPPPFRFTAPIAIYNLTFFFCFIHFNK